jgi:YD repeat-containing protein
MVSNVGYNAAGQMTSMSWLGKTETRTYNTLNQLTRQTVTGSGPLMDVEYRYSATQNNGRITHQKDWVVNEEVAYQYDSLQRLISAVTTGPEWGQSFEYDGFGNLKAQTVTKGAAPSMSLTIDSTTNRVMQYGYDANGNVIQNGTQSIATTWRTGWKV